MQLPAILKKHNLNFELGNAVYDGSFVKFNGFRFFNGRCQNTGYERTSDRENEFRKQMI